MGNLLTEVASLSLKSPEASRKVIQVLNTILLAQPGCVRVSSGSIVEDATRSRSFIKWDDVSQRDRFRASPAYEELLDKLEPFATSAPQFHTVTFNELSLSPVSDSTRQLPIVENLYLHFPYDDSFTAEMREKATSNVERFLNESADDAITAGATGETVMGWVVEAVDFNGEPSRVLAVLIGWESVEAHLKYRGSESYAKNIPIVRATGGLKGVSVVHTAD